MITIQSITQEAYKNRFIYNAATQLLGEGGFAKVYEGFDTLHQRTVALKVFTGSNTTRYNLAREVQQMQQVPPHQNVVSYYEVLEVSTTGTDVHGNNLKQQIAVIEYANYQTLEELMQKQIPDEQRKDLLTNILKGLHHLHQNNIIHRDLKPRNILIHNENGKLIPKITDFGIAKAITESDATATQTATGIIGTAAYLAPEQIAPEQFGENGKVNTKADIWSFGVIVYEWIADKKLYAGNTTNSSNAQIINAVLKGVNKEQLAILPQPYKSVVEKCLVQKAVERGNVVSIIEELNLQPKPKIEFQDLKQTQKSVTQDVKKKNRRNLITIFCSIFLISMVIFFYQSQKIFISAKYDRVSLFKNGMARVELNNKIGFVDSMGNEVIEPKFSQAEDFNQGLAAVVLNDRHVHIDKKGKIITPDKYDGSLQDFSEGRVVVKLKDKFGFIDISGTEIIPPIYDYVNSFSEGLASVKINNKIGYIDKYGNEIISPKFSDGGSFSNGLANVDAYFQNTLNIYPAFIDKSGNEVITLDNDVNVAYNSRDSGFVKFSEEKIIVYRRSWIGQDGKYGYIDKFGNEITPICYDNARSFSGGFAGVQLNNKWAFIDKLGTQITPFKYDDNIGYFSDGIARVSVDNKSIFINKDGKEIITGYGRSPIWARFYTAFPEGLAPVELNGKWGFIDKLGNRVIPLKYEEANYFTEGLALVKDDGKFGFIDKNGKVVVPFKYDGALFFREGLAPVELNGKWGFIKKPFSK